MYFWYTNSKSPNYGLGVRLNAYSGLTSLGMKDQDKKIHYWFGGAVEVEQIVFGFLAPGFFLDISGSDFHPYKGATTTVGPSIAIIFKNLKNNHVRAGFRFNLTGSGHKYEGYVQLKKGLLSAGLYFRYRGEAPSLTVVGIRTGFGFPW